MRFIRVQYDNYNRQFKSADRELASQMGDGYTYLIADLSDNYGTVTLEPPAPLSSNTDSGKWLLS